MVVEASAVDEPAEMEEVAWLELVSRVEDTTLDEDGDDVVSCELLRGRGVEDSDDVVPAPTEELLETRAELLAAGEEEEAALLDEGPAEEVVLPTGTRSSIRLLAESDPNGALRFPEI